MCTFQDRIIFSTLPKSNIEKHQWLCIYIGKTTLNDKLSRTFYTHFLFIQLLFPENQAIFSIGGYEAIASISARYIHVLYKRICEIALFYSFTVVQSLKQFFNRPFYSQICIVLVLLTLPILRSFNPCHYPPACFVCFYLNAYIRKQLKYIFSLYRNVIKHQNGIE